MANSKRLGPSPVIKLFDTDGTVLASGTVETYITGTSTPKNSYTDSAGSGSASSFTLDAYGEAVRYFDTDVAYKLIIKDSSGSTVRTVDPYTPVPAPFQLDNDLDVNGFSIVSSSNGDIAITPNGTGDIVLDGLKWPQADGTTGQVLKTDGSAQLSWTTVAVDLVDDTTPQLGADLDCNAYNIKFDTGDGVLDSAGNEQLLFTETSSAVNYVNMTNAIANSAPIIAAAGSDSNIDINITAKGTGNVTISGVKYPSADGDSGDVLQTDGSGNLSFVSIAQSLSYASQAEMEAATDTTKAVTAGTEIYAPGAAKAWVTFQIDGTIDSSHNVTSVTDSGTGNFTVNFDVTFTSSKMVAMATPIDSTGVDLTTVTSPGTTSCQILTYDGGTLTDPSYGICAVFFGDL